MSNTYIPGPTPNTVRAADGRVLTAPDGWVLLPPGDAALTRRVKDAGDHWIVQEKRGRKVFSRGVWAPATTIDRIRAELEAERSTEGYAKRTAADAQRRDKAQAEYVEDFFGAVVGFLAFHPDHTNLANRMARAVTDHATPVGSGTVARTKRIPVEQRAEAAVIAWMRHQTTGYEGMVIPRIKGKRREVRRLLARRSHELLDGYRRGLPVPAGCPLQRALASKPSAQGQEPELDILERKQVILSHMSDPKQKVTEFFQRFRAEALQTIDHCAVAFYGVQNERIVKDRTGVLLRIADSVFILTASHDLREIVENSIPLYVSWNERTELPIPLHDARFHLTESESRWGERDVVRDVAAIKLSDSTAGEILAGGRKAMSLCDLDGNQDRTPAIFFTFGFPQAWFRMEGSGPKCLPLVYGCGIHAGDHWTGASIGYDPKVHLLLDFKRDAIRPIERQPHTLPGYQGIRGVSGCGIWRVIDLNGSVDKWKPGDCKLVAIQHRYYEEPGYLHTTWIQYAVNRIFEDYPELKSAAKIVYSR